MRTEPSFSAEPETDLLNSSRDSHFSSAQFEPESKLLTDYRQRYGLSVDPFADDPHFPFYTGAQRRQILDQLLHLCQFSHNLLVVVGEYGTGKTRMAQALIDSLDDADDICFLDSQVTSTYDSLMADILAQCELPDVASFNDFIQRSTGHEGLAVIIVDNAHHLADDVLLDLISLIQGGSSLRLHLVLLAEPHLLDRLEHFDVPEVILSDFSLESFSLAEAVDYLNFRMEMADYLGPEIFTEAKVEPWWRQAQGQLLILHEHAQQKLLASVSSSNKFVINKRGIPMPHIIAASSLVAILAMGFLYFGSSSSKPTTQLTEPIPIPKPAGITAAVSSSTASLAANVTQSAQVSSAQTVEATSAQPVVVAAPTASLAISSAATHLSSAATQVVKQSVVPLVQTNASRSADAVKVTKSSVASSVSVKKTEVANEAKPVVKPEETRSEKAKSVTASAATGFSEQEKMLLSWDESEFTLQLVGLSSEKSVREFVAEQPNKKDLLVFKSLRQGKDWFVVVTGRYSSSAKARQAAQLLPESQKKAAPWPRDIKTIHREIKQK